MTYQLLKQAEALRDDIAKLNLQTPVAFDILHNMEAVVRDLRMEVFKK